MSTNFFEFLDKMDKKQPKQNKPKQVEPKQNKPKQVKPKQIVEENLQEQYVETGLSYATAFIKSIRKNFKNKEERNIVLESVRTAINLCLGHQVSTTPTIKIKQKKNVSKVQENIPVENSVIETSVPLSEDAYNRNCNIELKVNNHGNREVDLSRMSAKDIDDIKVLSGLK